MADDQNVDGTYAVDRSADDIDMATTTTDGQKDGYPDTPPR